MFLETYNCPINYSNYYKYRKRILQTDLLTMKIMRWYWKMGTFYFQFHTIWNYKSIFLKKKHTQHTLLSLSTTWSDQVDRPICCSLLQEWGVDTRMGLPTRCPEVYEHCLMIGNRSSKITKLLGVVVAVLLAPEDLSTFQAAQLKPG